MGGEKGGASRKASGRRRPHAALRSGRGGGGASRKASGRHTARILRVAPQSELELAQQEGVDRQQEERASRRKSTRNAGGPLPCPGKRGWHRGRSRSWHSRARKGGGWPHPGSAGGISVGAGPGAAEGRRSSTGAKGEQAVAAQVDKERRRAGAVSREARVAPRSEPELAR